MPRHEDQSIPERIKALPMCPTRHINVPWFVAWVDGKPEFRCFDGEKLVRAVREKRCWVCGEPLGRLFTFVAGPMCGINRTSSEPPSHTECAIYSATHCPFLSRPHMERREGGLEKLPLEDPAGHMIRRNPGVTMLWTTRSYVVFRQGGGVLFRIGPPVTVQWFREGRLATRAEVAEAVRTGLPALEELAGDDENARRTLTTLATQFEAYYPEEQT